jgi:hypothetical protein
MFDSFIAGLANALRNLADTLNPPVIESPPPSPVYRSRYPSADQINFHVAGLKHYVLPARIKEITWHMIVQLVTEPSNAYDHFAVAIYLDGQKIGYVPRQVNRGIFNLLTDGIKVIACVRQVNINAPTWKAVEIQAVVKSPVARPNVPAAALRHPVRRSYADECELREEHGNEPGEEMFP